MGFLEGVWHVLSDVYTVIKVVDGILRFTDGGGRLIWMLSYYNYTQGQMRRYFEINFGDAKVTV